jgi:PAS domain S-box-containing protein
VPELERRIATQMERWQTLINNAKLLIFGLDPRGRINFVNPHFLDSTGYTEDESHRSAADGFRASIGEG